MTVRTLLLAMSLAAAPILPAVVHAQTIAPDQLESSVRTLASDLFQGRAPGTIGEERTIGYLVGRFQALGLEPGGPDGQCCLLYTSPSPRDKRQSRMPSSA